MTKIRKGFFRYDNVGMLFVLPAFIYMISFVGYPIIYNFILSLQNVTVKNLRTGQHEFVTFKNYIDLFTHDDVLVRSIVNTLVFTVACLIFQFLIGFALALFFNREFWLSRPVRGLMMIPWMIPITISGLIFKFMFSNDVGIINFFLKTLGIVKDNIEWLTNPKTAMPAVIMTNIWIGIPFNMILLAAGLTTIPSELYESASIDGASKVQRLFRITLPLLRPTIESVLILGFIYTFKVYDLVYVMTTGGPVNATQLLSTYSYKLSFDMFKYSQGAAVANILFIVLFLVSLLYLRFIDTEIET
ncbi:MAG: sugar ABC transporter permease [Clostridiaceae bacterium]|jgi:multiple sugar transport system permease protein|nr:sugar ABC transporter permease [Clostridiaceae bacterium]